LRGAARFITVFRARAALRRRGFDVDISVRFKPMAGREDASGGIVFRFAEGHYYVVRANALENNFRLYSYDRGRHQLATANVQPPALGQWHTIRVVAVGDHIQAYLNGALLLEHRDSRYRAGQVGLWTKADSITAFASRPIGVSADTSARSMSPVEICAMP
jgi:hypothetical protein